MDHRPDPELAAIAPLLPSSDMSDLAVAREQEQRFLTGGPAYVPERKLEITDVVIPGLSGNPPVSARLIAAEEAGKRLPCLLYLHGGGYVLGSLASVDNQARRIADEVDVAVLAVDYRLAPEHPYPAALEDAYAALIWSTSPGAAAHFVDPHRVGVLGDSAGGGLAAALTLLAAERGGPVITAQFLDAPTVDDRGGTPSIRELTDVPIWRSADTPVIWRHYLGVRYGTSDVPATAAPARATTAQLAGLPPAWLASYQLDPTRDEGLDYARKLIQAGVPTDIHHAAGAFHLTHLIPGTAIGERLAAERLAAIRRLLTRPDPVRAGECSS
ncbi:MAG: alpha/beta hydrolase [Trebonia sp.]